MKWGGTGLDVDHAPVREAPLISSKTVSPLGEPTFHAGRERQIADPVGLTPCRSRLSRVLDEIGASAVRLVL